MTGIEVVVSIVFSLMVGLSICAVFSWIWFCVSVYKSNKACNAMIASALNDA